MRLDSKDLEIIAAFRQSEICPSYREIAGIISMSYGGTKDRIKKLIRDGFLDKKPGSERAVRVTEKGLSLFPEFIIVGRDKDGMPVTTVLDWHTD
jgi:DNA-binding MarR family transcriptional regulator